MRKPFRPSHSHELLFSLYIKEEKSTYQIAAELNCTQDLVRKELVYYRIRLRTKAEAQAVALKKGRAKPPCEGPRSEEVKEKISSTLKRKEERCPEADQNE